MSEEDDGGGGGRVKKKRKKKDKREWEKAGVECEEKESSKPKKRREEKEPIVVSLRKSKEPKEAKEGKERKERRTKGKEGRTESETVLRNASGVKTPGAAVSPGPAQMPVKVPGKRGRKPKVKVLPPVPSNQGLKSVKCFCLCGNGSKKFWIVFLIV